MSRLSIWPLPGRSSTLENPAGSNCHIRDRRSGNISRNHGRLPRVVGKRGAGSTEQAGGKWSSRSITRIGSCRLFQSPISIALKFLRRKNFGGGGGNRTPVRESSISVTTCLAVVLISLFEPPAAGSLGASRFRSQPHPLRQRNQPIPLNDALSDPVGENR